MKFLGRRLSRRWGWANEKFRAAYKQDHTIATSKTYERTQQKISKLHKEIARKREQYNNEITRKITDTYSEIGVETLNVSGMFKNKHLSNALSDAAMYQVLNMLDYKSRWFGGTVQAINQWTPSSKRCSNCGYVLPKLSLSTREWTCPQCGEYHDRDVNAAKNIEYYAFDALNLAETSKA